MMCHTTHLRPLTLADGQRALLLSLMFLLARGFHHVAAFVVRRSRDGRSFGARSRRPLHDRAPIHHSFPVVISVLARHSRYSKVVGKTARNTACAVHPAAALGCRRQVRPSNSGYLRSTEAPDRRGRLAASNRGEHARRGIQPLAGLVVVRESAVGVSPTHTLLLRELRQSAVSLQSGGCIGSLQFRHRADLGLASFRSGRHMAG